MKFQCFVCDIKSPCSLITEYIGGVYPTICPFKTEKTAIADWKIVDSKKQKSGTAGDDGKE